jgi:hypothetical protein
MLYGNDRNVPYSDYEFEHNLLYPVDDDTQFAVLYL